MAVGTGIQISIGEVHVLEMWLRLGQTNNKLSPTWRQEEKYTNAAWRQNDTGQDTAWR